MTTNTSLTMTFTLDNGKDFDINVSNARDGLAKTDTDAVMQAAIDGQVFQKDGHLVTGIKEAYTTTTEKNVLE